MGVWETDWAVVVVGLLTGDWCGRFSFISLLQSHIHLKAASFFSLLAVLRWLFYPLSLMLLFSCSFSFCLYFFFAPLLISALCFAARPPPHIFTFSNYFFSIITCILASDIFWYISPHLLRRIFPSCFAFLFFCSLIPIHPTQHILPSIPSKMTFDVTSLRQELTECSLT